MGHSRKRQPGLGPEWVAIVGSSASQARTVRADGRLRWVVLSGFAGLGLVTAAMADEAAMQDVVTIYGDRGLSDPGSNAVIDGETVITLAADHPAELLNTLPGVNIQMNSGQEHLIAI
ncbi:MAG: hypothetical protein AAFR00_11575, partial [Pseudomonadota bacterium]